MKTYNHKGCKVTLRKEEYSNNEALAVALIKENGESYGTISVNLDNPLQSNELAFINEKHFPGIRK